MVIIGTISFPTESSKEMGKRFMEVPAFINKRGPYFNSELGVGIKCISIFEFEPSNMAEAIVFVNDYYATYIGVPGYSYTIDTWLEAFEALKLVGLG
ncbi:MAG: hypothetical protein WAN57_04765 [Smithella sp.]